MLRFRVDAGKLEGGSRESRKADRILAHYQFEKALAARLRGASKEARLTLYGQLYSQLFSEILDHPQLTRPLKELSARISPQLSLLAPYLDVPLTFVEIGCGDASLSIAVAARGHSSIGVDVTDKLIPSQTSANFRFLLTDGIALNIESSSVDLVYSNQLMEHLHPEDANEQLLEIIRILKPCGKYICVTPSRLTGPHDVSRDFDMVATGFHIQEYDYGSLKRAFHDAGFRKYYAVVMIKGYKIPLPYILIRPMEMLVDRMPAHIRSKVRRSRIAEVLFGIVAVGVR